MSVKEFYRIMARAHAKPYRSGGRVRVAYTGGTPDRTLDLMKKAVQEMAGRIADGLEEPDADTRRAWAAANLRQMDVCDEPCPDGVRLTEVDPGWLLDRARERYHCEFYLGEDGALKHRGVGGWQAKDEPTKWGVRSGYLSVTPAWFVQAVKMRKADIVAFLKGGGHCPPPREPEVPA